MLEVNSIVGVAVLIVLSSFSAVGFWSYFTSEIKEIKDMQTLMKGLAYYRLVSEISKHLKDGHVSKEEYDSIYLYLYQPYENLGGTGLVKIYMQSLLELLMDQGTADMNQSGDGEPSITPKYMTDTKGNQYKLDQL